MAGKQGPQGGGNYSFFTVHTGGVFFPGSPCFRIENSARPGGIKADGKVGEAESRQEQSSGKSKEKFFPAQQGGKPKGQETFQPRQERASIDLNICMTAAEKVIQVGGVAAFAEVGLQVAEIRGALAVKPDQIIQFVLRQSFQAPAFHMGED